MIDLDKRANFNVNLINVFCEEIPLIRFEDHRSTLIPMYHARKIGNIIPENPPTLLCFDHHDDGLAPKDIESLAKFTNSEVDIREFFDYVEWELSTGDDDWLKAGMEIGLIGDVIMFGVERDSNFQLPKNGYLDHRGVVHNIWMLKHLWHELSMAGSLGDLAKKDEVEDLWRVLGWNGRSFCEPTSKFIVDFDLDCFSHTIGGMRMAWPQDVIAAKFETRVEGSQHNSYVPREFLQSIMVKSIYISVCHESDCCGGLGESVRVLEVLDDLFWENTLFPRPESNLRS